MRPNQTPFPACWYGIELPGYRDHNFTLRRFVYDSLPPLPEHLFSGEFQWLPEEPWSKEPKCGDTEEYRGTWLAQLNKLAADAAGLKLALPPAFLHYMRTDLRDRLPSCVGCYYRLPDRIAESPKGANGYLLAFLSDSQNCLAWYLYLNQATGDHCVVVSWDYFGFDKGPGPQFLEEPENVLFCAPSFEAFIYRFWIENSIWFALAQDKRALTTDELAYAVHCQQHSRAWQ